LAGSGLGTGESGLQTKVNVRKILGARNRKIGTETPGEPGFGGNAGAKKGVGFGKDSNPGSRLKVERRTRIMWRNERYQKNEEGN
jgi:hypothetical protein